MSNTWVTGNRYLSQAEMENNAEIIYGYFNNQGWTLEAICGMLGNFQRESTINPGIWQNLMVAESNGYGLAQWTPSTNVTNWLRQQGYAIDDGTAQCEWIVTQTVPTGQWIPTSQYGMSFAEYIVSTDSPETLAEAWCLNFERAGVSAMEERRQYARRWYNYFEGTTPPDPPDPPTPTPGTKKAKMPLYFYRGFL